MSRDAGKSSRGLSLEERIRNIEDREEIRELMIAYHRALDLRQWDNFAELFAEKDSEWLFSKGRAAIRKRVEEAIPPLKNFHWLANEVIKVNGDRATAQAKYVVVVPGEDKKPVPKAAGRYDDIFVRDNGKWKFLQRNMFADISDIIPPPEWK
jgi:3-phenylpropionate/cinnamic acid dioxygenase small subunit